MILQEIIKSGKKLCIFEQEKRKMVGKFKKREFNEIFIDIWREEKSLWDVTSVVYKDRTAKNKSYGIFKEKLDMEG